MQLSALGHSKKRGRTLDTPAGLAETQTSGIGPKSATHGSEVALVPGAHPGSRRMHTKEMTHFARKPINQSQQRTECPQQRGYCTGEDQRGGGRILPWQGPLWEG